VDVIKHNKSRQWVMGIEVHDGKARELGGVPSGGDHAWELPARSQPKTSN